MRSAQFTPLQASDRVYVQTKHPNKPTISAENKTEKWHLRPSAKPVKYDKQRIFELGWKSIAISTLHRSIEKNYAKNVVNSDEKLLI